MGRNGFRHALGFALAFGVLALVSAQGGRGGRGGGIPADIPPVLRKAFESAKKLRYSGERVVSYRRGHERRKHTEYVLKDGPRIRIDFPENSPMAGQVIVEDGKERQQFFPSRNEIHIMPAFHEAAFANLRMFFGRGPEKPKLTVSAGESVAGVRSTLVSFQDPRGNVFQKLWVDERSGLILKREMLDQVGTLVQGFEFTKLNYSPNIRNDDFVIRRPGAIRVTAEDLARRLMRENGMEPAFLREEKGYKLIGSRMLRRVENARVMILSYHTGKAPLSLVQIVGKFESERLERLVGKQFKSHSWQSGGRTFVLIGDMDEASLRRLAGRVEVR